MFYDFTDGGICERHKEYLEKGEDLVKRSLNTGVITMKRYNMMIPKKLSSLHFAQEMGRSFGSKVSNIVI